MASCFSETAVHLCGTPSAPSFRVSGISSDRISAFDASVDVCLSSPKEVAGLEQEGNPCFRGLTVVELTASFLGVAGLSSGDTSLKGPTSAGLAFPFLGARGVDLSGTPSLISSFEAAGTGLG